MRKVCMIERFYEDSLFHGEEIEEIASGNMPAVWVWGGRGIGKTTVLKRAQARVRSREPSAVVEEVDVRAPTGKGRLQSLAHQHERTASLFIFIDDMERTTDDRDILEALDTLTKEGRHRPPTLNRLSVVAFSRHSPDVALNTYGELWSRIDWHRILLDPWKRGWKFRIRDVLNDLLVGRGEITTTAWFQSLIRVTGGHPVFLGPGLGELQQMLSIPEDERLPIERKLLDPAASSEFLSSLSVDIQRFLTSRVFNPGLPCIRRAVDFLREENKEAYQLLQRVALDDAPRLPDNFEEVADSQAAILHNAVLNSGLAYWSDEEPGLLVIAGELVRSVILSGVEEIKEQVVELVLQEAQGQSDRGVLLARTAGGQFPVSFAGNGWKIVKVLDEHRGGAVSLGELQTALGVDSEKAVNSAIQRLRLTLKEAGLEDVILNVRNQGYSLGESPLRYRYRRGGDSGKGV